MPLSRDQLKVFALELAAAMPPVPLDERNVTLTRKGAQNMREALLLGLVAIGERLRGGATLDRGDEIAVVARALQSIDLDDGGVAT
jgi:hypothetical protein